MTEQLWLTHFREAKFKSDRINKLAGLNRFCCFKTTWIPKVSLPFMQILFDKLRFISNSNMMIFLQEVPSAAPEVLPAAINTCKQI